MPKSANPEVPFVLRAIAPGDVVEMTESFVNKHGAGPILDAHTQGFIVAGRKLKGNSHVEWNFYNIAGNWHASPDRECFAQTLAEFSKPPNERSFLIANTVFLKLSGLGEFERQARASVPTLPTAEKTDGKATKTRSLGEYVGGESAILAIVFTDIIGSTEMKTKLGNHEYGIRRDHHFERAGRLIGECSGWKVKSLGDGLLAVFKGQDQALSFALSLHRDTGHETIRVRVGIHSGPVTINDNDVYGQDVDYARRIVDSFHEDRIRVSDEFKRAIEKIGRPEHRGIWTSYVVTNLKGFDGEHVLWEAKQTA